MDDWFWQAAVGMPSNLFNRPVVALATPRLNAFAGCLLTSVPLGDLRSNQVLSIATAGALVLEAAQTMLRHCSHDPRQPLAELAGLLSLRIQDNPLQPLAITEFAAEQRISRRQLERAFRDAWGVSPLQFRLACRMAMAKDLIQATKLSMLSVAVACGWNSVSTMCRLLRRGNANKRHIENLESLNSTKS